MQTESKVDVVPFFEILTMALRRQVLDSKLVRLYTYTLYSTKQGRFTLSITLQHLNLFLVVWPAEQLPLFNDELLSPLKTATTHDTDEALNMKHVIERFHDQLVWTQLF